jgi:hypothetical protein
VYPPPSPSPAPSPAQQAVLGSFPSDSQDRQVDRQDGPQAIRDINGDVSIENVIQGTRKRTARKDPYLASYFTYDDRDDHEGVLAAFASALSTTRPEPRYHRDDLPAEP